MPMNYSPQSPWMNIDPDLMNIMGASTPNYSSASMPPSFSMGDQDTQALINSQASAAPGFSSNFPPAVPAQPMGGSSRVSGSAPVDISGLKRLAKMLDQESTNNEGYKLQQDQIAKLKAYRDKMPTGNAGVDLSPLFSLVDTWNKTDTAKNYKRPETAEERAAKIAAVDEALASQGKNLSAERMAGLEKQVPLEIAKVHYGQSNDTKEQDNEEKDAKALTDALNTEVKSGRFTAIGKAHANVFQAQRLQALLDQYKADPNSMPLKGPSSISEMAIGINNLLAPGVGSEGSRESLVPASAQGKYSSLESYFANEPTGAGMADFIKNIQDTLRREANTNAKQVMDSRERIKITSGTGRLAKRNPQRYNTIIDTYLNDPALAQQSEDGATAHSYGSDVVDYAKSHGITPEQAQRVKDSRTGK